MNERRLRLRPQRQSADPSTEVSAALVRRIVDEALADAGLAEFRQWKDGIENQLQVLRIIHHDLRDAVALSITNQGSAKTRLQELLEGMAQTLVNVDELMQPGDVPEPTQQQILLARVFDRYRDTPDTQNEAVESDDFVDPVEEMFDADPEPRTRRRRRTR